MRILTLIFALCTLQSACVFCNPPEERAITVSAVDSLAITVDGRATSLQLGARVGQWEIDRARFDPVFNAVEDGGSSGTAILVSLGGTDPATNEQFLLTLALPADLDRGDVYAVSKTFVVEPGFSTDPLVWGSRASHPANTADVAFATSSYTFPPPVFTVNYRASTANGTIRITQRKNDYFEMTLDIDLVDSAGRTAFINGRVQVQSERYTPGCT